MCANCDAIAKLPEQCPMCFHFTYFAHIDDLGGGLYMRCSHCAYLEMEHEVALRNPAELLRELARLEAKECGLGIDEESFQKLIDSYNQPYREPS